MALQGTIDSFPIVDVLQLLSTSKKSGRLEVSGDRGRGAMWVLDGELVAAMVQGRHSSDAAEGLWDLLRFEDGSFEFSEGDPPPDERFGACSVEATIAKATGMLSEWTEIEQKVPSLQHVVVLAASLPEASVELSSEDWELVVGAGPSPGVGELIDRVGLEEFEGCRRIAEMVERGLMEVAASRRPAEHLEAPRPSAGLDTPLPEDPVGPSGMAVVDSVSQPGGQTPLVVEPERPAPAPMADAFARPLQEAGSGAHGIPGEAFGPQTGDPEAAMGSVGAPLGAIGGESGSGEPAAVHPAGRARSVTDRLDEPAGFPAHFPIDDLVTDASNSWDETSRWDAPQVARSGEPVAAGEGGFHTAVPPEAGFDTAVPPVAAAPPVIAAPPEPGFDTAAPPVAAAPPEPGFDTAAPPVAAAPPATYAPQAASAPEGATTPDDVLAQIGRLSPKAAEAIAAALGEGESRGHAG